MRILSGTSHNKEDIYNADASFPENVRNGSGESSKIATSGEVEGSETIQTSRHSSDLNVQANDQEVDVAEIDNIIAKKISCLLLESEFTLEYGRKSRKKLHKDKIDKDVHEWLRSDPGQIRSLNDLEQWKAKFSDLKSIDADLTFKTMEFCNNQCLRREIMQNREWDFIVKILGLIIGTLLEEFDIGTFELNRTKKESRSVTNRKRKDVHEEYTTLTSEMKKNGPNHLTFKTKGNDENLLWSKLHFKKVELEEVFALGIQITGTRWTIYSLSYDNSQNFYFFFEIKRPTLVEMATLILLITFSDMEDLLPDFLENLFAL
ncbi:unnamed protein product [Rhizophagus irregularis]|nr:unnamed protein product [Rhizophagus irregularis]